MSEKVFPTHVGVNPHLPNMAGYHESLPHTRGGEPGRYLPAVLP